MVKVITSPLKWLPAAADSIGITPSGTIWANSAWVELVASAPTAVYPVFLAATPNAGAVIASSVSTEFDIGVGASGSEVVVATIRVRIMPNHWGPSSSVPLGVILSSIPSGSRIAIRLRHGLSGNTNLYRVSLGYYDAIGGASGWASAVPTIVPTGSGAIQILGSGSVAWAYGAWIEMLPAASVVTNILVTGIITAAIDTVNELQIGTGASGSETAIATLPFATAPTGGGGDGFLYHRFPRPFCVNAGTRISMRTRFAATSRSANAFFGTLWYVANR